MKSKEWEFGKIYTEEPDLDKAKESGREVGRKSLNLKTSSALKAEDIKRIMEIIDEVKKDMYDATNIKEITGAIRFKIKEEFGNGN